MYICELITYSSITSVLSAIDTIDKILSIEIKFTDNTPVLKVMTAKSLCIYIFFKTDMLDNAIHIICSYKEFLYEPLFVIRELSKKVGGFLNEESSELEDSSFDNFVKIDATHTIQDSFDLDKFIKILSWK